MRIPAKVNVSLEINTLVEIVDEGYLGAEATVQEHIDGAIADVNNWQWFVKKGGNDLVQLGVRTKVVGVTILPKDRAEWNT